MTFKENLLTKIKLDRLFQNILSTIKDIPGQRRLDKKLTRELLELTDFKHQEVRDLHLYARPLQGEVMEVLVLDNELPLYHTTVEDVALRKSPYWQEIISLRNIKKILNDKDVVASRGRESLKRIHTQALDLLDLSYSREDLASIVNDARQGLEQKSFILIRESLDLFIELLDFQVLALGEPEPKPEPDVQILARPKHNGDPFPTFEPLIIFDREKLWLSLKKKTFSPFSEADLAWVGQYTRGEEPADLQGIAVFEYLCELALVNMKA